MSISHYNHPKSDPFRRGFDVVDDFPVYGDDKKSNDRDDRQADRISPEPNLERRPKHRIEGMTLSEKIIGMNAISSTVERPSTNDTRTH